MQINFAADGDSATMQTEPGSASGLVELFVQPVGDFGGGTLALQVDLGAGFVSEYTWTEVGSRIFELPANVDYKFNLDGATAPDLDIELR